MASSARASGSAAKHHVDQEHVRPSAEERDDEPKTPVIRNNLGDILGEEAVEERYTTSDDRRQVSFVSAVFLIFNRMVGTGIFATPAEIVSLSGSVGLSLFIWVIGMLIAFSGMMTYLEFGTGIPRNGGEKNYLEYVYRKPKFLATAMYAGYVVLLGWAGSNSVIFGEYILNAANVEVGRWNQRGVGLACVTTLGGHLKVEKPDNFSNAFEGTTGSAYGIVTALYNVIWSYIGYSNANYALSETKNPVQTLKRAAPAALILVSILYMLTNIAYFAAVPKADIISSGRIVAATFFRNMFGTRAERVLSVFVALSAYGNVLSVIFSQGRLVQEVAREGILPWSRLWASNKPLNAPFMGLFEHWLVSVIIMLAPPPGDAYNFILKGAEEKGVGHAEAEEEDEDGEDGSDRRYTRVQIGPPDVAINVLISTWIGPRWASKWWFEASRAAAAEVGYSPPTPTPEIPRAMERNQSMFEEGETWKANVDMRVPMTTSKEVNTMPDFREYRSDV
ncbi:hypothetical protein G7Y89_g11673 [Cudoniella acicularis]|uniref:High-affinity methionine permease n=1 Tax=Cudoniella acicularis TaxID=354080 RepID=A0A8H4VXT2_9HELO|nr:hypothetical protein G7Y89_g11673 [Cudoniella acicularis]